MQIYAACLASYNSGRLHGAWIEATSDADAMRADIAAMLRNSPCPNVMVECPTCEGDRVEPAPALREDGTIPVCQTCKGNGEVPSAEEWAIHDYDGFPNLGEYPGLEDVAEMAALFEDHDEIDADDLAAILKDFTDAKEASEALRDKFCGIMDSFRDYADEAADESLAAYGIKDGNFLARYFDYEAFARDLAFDMRVIDCPSGVAVFHA